MSAATNNQVISALAAWEVWNELGVSGRSTILTNFAGNLVNDSANMALWQLNNAKQKIAEVMLMPGPTGEANELFTAGRGLFICHADNSATETAIVGQLVTALVAGNVVLISGDHPALDSLHQQLLAAGCADTVVQRVNDDLDTFISQPDIAGIAYAGHASPVAIINRKLSARDGNLAQLIVENNMAKLPVIASPYYLLRFITERTRSDNTTAVGGNATLLELGSGED